MSFEENKQDHVRGQSPQPFSGHNTHRYENVRMAQKMDVAACGPCLSLPLFPRMRRCSLEGLPASL